MGSMETTLKMDLIQMQKNTVKSDKLRNIFVKSYFQSWIQLKSRSFLNEYTYTQKK